MFTTKHVMVAHEVRMWIKEIILPVGTVTIVLASNPQVREGVKTICKNVKESIKSKFSKFRKKESN